MAIYLDNAATTPLCPDAAKAMETVLYENFGNPSSLHRLGFEAERTLAKARETLASALSASPKEVVFTPSGTLSINLAVLGAARKRKNRGKHIISTAIEHDATLSALAMLEQEGFRVTLVQPDREGRIAAQDVAAALTEETVLVSVMLANNVTGRVQPVAEIAEILRRKGGKTLLHSDAVQGFMKMPLSVRALGVDLLSVSGHKIGGPKGIGALFVKKGVGLLPLWGGGGQEGGLVPGTENVPAIAGFAAAAESASLAQWAEMAQRKAKAIALLCEEVPGLVLLSDGDLPGLFTVSLPKFQSETLVHFLAERNIFVSGGAACGKGKPSKALLAMGLSAETVAGALRVSMSPETTEKDLRTFAEALRLGATTLAHR